MKFATISDDFFDLCSFDKELLHNEHEKRPYLIILSLKYKGKRHDFALPFRSNIPSHAPKELYYSLPPRSTTKVKHIHGLHYIKMFPITKKYLKKFNKNKDPYYQLIDDIIQRNRKSIIEESQNYLVNYENGTRPDFSTSIDRIFDALYDIQLDEVAVTLELKK